MSGRATPVVEVDGNLIGSVEFDSFSKTKCVEVRIVRRGRESSGNLIVRRVSRDGHEVTTRIHFSRAAEFAALVARAAKELAR